MEYIERKINSHLILKIYHIQGSKLIYLVKDEEEIAEVIPTENLESGFCNLLIDAINGG